LADGSPMTITFIERMCCQRLIVNSSVYCKGNNVVISLVNVLSWLIMFVHNELVVKYSKLNNSFQNLYPTNHIHLHSEPPCWGWMNGQAGVEYGCRTCERGKPVILTELTT